MITIFARCPNCKKLIEAHGQWLQVVELKTKEAWIIECESCDHVFVHKPSKIEQSEQPRKPANNRDGKVK